MRIISITVIGCIILSFLGPLFGQENDQFAYIVADNVNLRKEPNVKAESYGFLKYATKVQVIKKTETKTKINNIEDYWFFCRIEAMEGWVFGGFLSSKNIDLDAYIKSLSPLSDMSDEYKLLINGKWLNCTVKEAREGGMGCYKVEFTNKLLITRFPLGDVFYQVLDVKTSKADMILKVKMIMSDTVVRFNYQDYQLNISGIKDFYFLKITSDRNEKSISINGEKYYQNGN